MNKKQVIRIAVDAAMTVILLLLMGYSKIGEFAHEWLGVAMTALFVIHHILNRKWLKSVFRGKYTPYRVFQTITASLIFLTMLGSAVSGVILSRYIFASLNLGGAYLARTVHMLCGYWNFVLLSLHLGIHWAMMIGMVSRETLIKSIPAPLIDESSRRGIDGKAFNQRIPEKMLKNKPYWKWMARGFAVLVAAYGIYAFVARQLPEYLFGITQFIFFDEDEPMAMFLLDYIAVMGLFVCIGHYIALLLKQFHKNKKKH